MICPSRLATRMWHTSSPIRTSTHFTGCSTWQHRGAAPHHCGRKQTERLGSSAHNRIVNTPNNQGVPYGFNALLECDDAVLVGNVFQNALAGSGLGVRGRRNNLVINNNKFIDNGWHNRQGLVGRWADDCRRRQFADHRQRIPGQHGYRSDLWRRPQQHHPRQHNRAHCRCRGRSVCRPDDSQVVEQLR